MHAVNTEHRDLTLMFTDIVGYSRLMGRDEALTIDMLGQYREILLSHIRAQNGVLVEFAGDAIFARFDSPLEAVNAAIAIQQHLSAFNETRDKKLPRLQTRIGLHKGEVTLRDNAVFGDSVNIAARLEPLAVPDAICISQAVYEDIRFTLSSPAKPLGNQTLKNIDHKVRAYLVKPSGIGWRDHLHYFLRGVNRKIVAYRYPLTACLFVLIAAGIYFIPRWLVPGYAANYVEIADFENLMDEKGEADYFSAGITEAVRSQLADMRDVYIVDAKEGMHAPIRLEGSVQKLGNDLRIAYRLFRRKDSVQIAGGKLDGTVQDIFILQDRLVGEVARYLADEFDLKNFRPAPLKLTSDITAYDFYLRGLESLNGELSHEKTDEAITNFKTALIHDREFSLANAGLCEAYWKKYEITNVLSWFNEAEKYCLTSIKLNNRTGKAFKALGGIYRDMGRFQEAISYLNNAIDIDSGDVTAYVALASTFFAKGDNLAAEKIYIETINNNPKNWRAYSGYAYYLSRVGRHVEAINNHKKVIEILPENVIALNNIAVNYYYLKNFKASADFFARAAIIEPSGVVFLNTGTVYYVDKNFKKAAEFYNLALRLEPDNYQYQAYLGDALKFIPHERNKANRYFEDVIKNASSEVELNSNIDKPYIYLARAYLYFGDLDKANYYMEKADTINNGSIESYYSHLRIAVVEEDIDKVLKYANLLLANEYTVELLLSDPDFSLLHREDLKKLLSSIQN